MVLSLHAHAALAAVEGAWWSHDHARCAERQRVSLFVRVYNPGEPVSIILPEVILLITVIDSLYVSLVLNVKALSLALGPQEITSSRR